MEIAGIAGAKAPGVPREEIVELTVGHLGIALLRVDAHVVHQEASNALVFTRSEDIGGVSCEPQREVADVDVWPRNKGRVLEAAGGKADEVGVVEPEVERPSPDVDAGMSLTSRDIVH